MSVMKQPMKGLVGAVSILVVGIVLGVATGHVFSVRASGASHQLPDRIGSPAEHQVVMVELTERLSLTEDQVADIHDVIAARQAAVDTAWTQIRRHLQQATAVTIAEIEGLLDEDQAARLREWAVERHGELPAVDSTGNED
jgi:hypothetical protein